MQVNFNPMVSNKNQYRQNFCAIPPKVADNWVKRIIDDIGLLNNDFNDDIAFRNITGTEAVAILQKVKKQMPAGFHGAIDRKINWAKSYQ